MSEAAAKATRRQLRRSIGETALGAVIEQGARLGTMDDRLRTIEAGQMRLWTAYSTTRTLTFLGRLRWLLTGSIHGLS